MKRKNIKFSSLAKKDTSYLWEYIARDDENIADSFIDDLLNRIESLQEFPFLGASKEIFKENERFLVWKKYNIYYRITENSIFIRRILHGKQDIKNL